MSVLPLLICRFSAVPIKIPASYFMDINKLILKFIWRGKRPRTANTLLKKNQVRGPTLPDFKTHYVAAAAKSLQSCPTLRPHRWQPTRLPRPWDSPGKNTGSGCHFLLQCMKVKSESEVAQSCPTPSDPMDCSPPGSSVHGSFQAGVLEWGAIAFSEDPL